jgi:fatty-acyl-CoA synthase
MAMSSERSHPFEERLGRNRANYVPLTPLSFLERSATVFADDIAIVQGRIRRTWRDTYRRCRQLASALTRAGVRPGDTVAVMGANTASTFEAHFGVPMAGAVLNAINTRLDPATVAFILQHGEAKVVFTDREFSRTMAPALAMLPKPPLVIDVVDTSDSGELLGSIDYEAFVAGGDPGFAWHRPADEWQALALNYTSGTTDNPKGVVYHHRGAYLTAVSNVLMWELGRRPVYLWTLPMFHCNGWGFIWTLTLLGGTSVCLRSVRGEPILALIESEGVTHLSGAPPVLATIVAAAEDPAVGGRITRKVRVLTGGAAPPPSLLERIERLGFEVTHGYGLTESYGPATICRYRDEWGALPPEERAQQKARQGVQVPLLDQMMVAEPSGLAPVRQDGQEVGEVLLRGNSIMKGYFKNPDATEECFRDGWFHTGDLAVWHPDGYIDIRDRSKDVINSGGEKIWSVEIEAVVSRHPAVLEAAVVAMPDGRWGESPCAFIALRDHVEVDEREIIAFCRQHLAHFKVPKSIVYGPLPKSATGKVRKNLLREQAQALALLL